MTFTLGVVELGGQSAWRRAHADRRLAGRTLLEWVVRQTTDAQRLDRVVVTLPEAADARRAAEGLPSDVPIVWTEETDCLATCAAALDQFQPDAIVRVGADTPFLDPALIDRLVTTAEEHRQCDYISYCSRSGSPTVLASLGLCAEWCRADALRVAEYEATDAVDRGDITRFIRAHPERFQLRMIPLPVAMDREDVRLAVAAGEDWDCAHLIHEALGAEELDWSRIAGLLEQQPALRERMAELNRLEHGTTDRA